MTSFCSQWPERLNIQQPFKARINSEKAVNLPCIYSSTKLSDRCEWRILLNNNGGVRSGYWPVQAAGEREANANTAVSLPQSVSENRASSPEISPLEPKACCWHPLLSENQNTRGGEQERTGPQRRAKAEPPPYIGDPQRQWSGDRRTRGSPNVRDRQPRIECGRQLGVPDREGDRWPKSGDQWLSHGSPQENDWDRSP